MDYEIHLLLHVFKNRTLYQIIKTSNIEPLGFYQNVTSFSELKFDTTLLCWIDHHKSSASFVKT